MSAHKERPILFSAPMVRAILAGRKTQTRRTALISRLDIHALDGGAITWSVHFTKPIKGVTSTVGAGRITEEQALSLIASNNCPYGMAGDRLWVRETWAHDAASVEQCRAKYEDAMGGPCCGPYYRATECAPGTLRWIPSIHMPRWASRINLGITSVRVERLQDISRGDCMAEGCPFPNMAESDPKKWYADLWDSINGNGAWDKNPWVWVVEFKRVTQP